MKPSEVLLAAKALIDAPSKWCQGVIHQAPNKYSPLGAMIIVDQPMAFEASIYFRKVLAPEEEIGTWNDDPVRTHEQVMETFDRAIALAESKGS